MKIISNMSMIVKNQDQKITSKQIIKEKKKTIKFDEKRNEKKESRVKVKENRKESKRNKDKDNDEKEEEDNEIDNENLISTDFIEILNDNKSNILEDDFLSSKKKMANAITGKSEIFDLVRQKLKALEMISLVLLNNKKLLKEGDFFFLDDLRFVFNQSKNDKSLFEPISKRVKHLISLILKNQIIHKNEENYAKIVNVIYEILK